MTKFWLIILLLLINIPLFPQSPSFPDGSRSDVADKDSSSMKHLRQVSRAILQGIAAGDFRKDNLIEYVPTTALELPRTFLSTPAGHPRLITPAQLQKARQNIHRPPHLQWRNLISENVQPYLHRPVIIQPVFRTAESLKNLAFLYRVENNPAYLQTAVKLLEQLPEPPRVVNFEGGAGNNGWGDFLQSAQALPALWVAVDLLYDKLDPGLLHSTRRKLVLVTGQFLDAMLYTPSNNHVTVMATATLITALMEEHPQEFIPFDRQEIWQTGLTYLSRGLGLIAPDGGYAEGVYYGNFITNYLAPFSIYLENAAGLKLYRHPYLERMVNWMLANEKGSGHYSAFDDAFQARFFYLPLIIPQSRLRQNWIAQWAAQPPIDRARDNLVEAICRFERSPFPVQSSESPVQFFPESGQAIFRDQAVQPRIFATFLSENERWFAARHEHIDPLSFELSAFGQDLIIDAGYGSGTGDPNRTWHLSAGGHNGILIDGLGTYRNPLWGDPLSSTMRHSFSTRRSAVTSLHHRISDVEMQRKVLFAGRRYFVMIDHVEGHTPHAVAQNFNYLGDLQQITDQQLKIQNQDAALQLFTLNSFDTPPLLLRGFSRYTPPGKPAPARLFQLEFPAVQRGYLVSLLYPQAAGDAPLHATRQALQGRGELLRFRESDTARTEVDLAVNPGGMLRSERWQSDAGVVWLRYDPAGRITGLLLVNFTRFRSDQLQFRSDFPITLFLEEGDFSWQGYIEAPDEKTEYQLMVEGIQKFPFRFKRLVQKQQSGSATKQQFTLKGSGTLDIGPVFEAVQTPYAYHRAPELLPWLNTHSQPRQQYQYWSDYQKQLVDNQIAATLWAGMQQGVTYWNQRLFSGGDLLRQASYALYGISQASYNRNSPSTYSIQLPHRYRFSGTTQSLRWSVMEDGVVSPDNYELRHVQLSARNSNGDGFAYRVARGFAGEQNHLLRLFDGGGQQATYQVARRQGQREQQVQMQLRGKEWQVQPGYAWNNQSDDDAFLSWQAHRFRGSLRRSRRTGEEQFYQSLGGYGRSWAFSLEGQQQGNNDEQLYMINGFIRPILFLNISPSAQLRKRGVWRIPHAAAEINYRKTGFSLRGRLTWNQTQWEQFFSGFSNFARHRLSASLNLRRFRFDRQSRLRLRWNYLLPGSWQAYTDLVYHYRPARHSYGANVVHTLSIPVGRNHYWQPLIGESIPGADPFRWLGVGYSYQGRSVLFGQIMLNRQTRPVQVNYQAALELFPSPAENTAALKLWLTVLQYGDRIEHTEIRLRPGGGSLQPGIYYSYLRRNGSRLEGFLEWQW